MKEQSGLRPLSSLSSKLNALAHRVGIHAGLAYSYRIVLALTWLLIRHRHKQSSVRKHHLLLRHQRVYLLAPPDAVTPRGPKLRERLHLWLEHQGAEVWKIEDVDDEVLGTLKPVAPILALVCDDLFVDAPPHAIRAQRFATKVAKVAALHNMPVVVALPDTFDLVFSLAAARIIQKTHGVALLLQNTPLEGAAFGLPRATGPLLWPHPPQAVADFGEALPWKSRTLDVLVPGTGDQKRLSTMSKLCRELDRQGVSWLATSGGLSTDDYRFELKRSKAVVTTCWTQAQYLHQPLVGKFVASTTTTGKVWESFTVRAALICNTTETLTSLGFIAGTHYLDLEGWLRSDCDWSFSDEQLESIADAGHIRFMELVNQREEYL